MQLNFNPLMSRGRLYLFSVKETKLSNWHNRRFSLPKVNAVCQVATLFRICAITSLCSFCGLNITMSVSSSALTLCPGGQ